MLGEIPGCYWLLPATTLNATRRQSIPHWQWAPRQIADTSDALRSTRPYKRGFTHAESVRIMTEGDERIYLLAHSDLQLLQLFHTHHLQFAAIWERLQDCSVR